MTVTELIARLENRTLPELRSTQVVFFEAGNIVVEINYVEVHPADGTVRLG